MEINPIIVKELRGRMRGARATITISIHLIAIAVIMMLTYASIYSSQFLNQSGTSGRILYYVIMGVQLLTLTVISVTSTTSSISSEREKQTYDVLLVTLLSPRQIILGKLTAALAYCFLLILVAVPLEVVAVMIGGVGLDEVLVGNVALAVMSIFYGVIGLYCSAVFRTSGGANGAAIGFVFFISLFWPLLVSLFTSVTRFYGGDNATWIVTWTLISLSPGAAFITSFGIIALDSGNSDLFIAKLPFGSNLYFLQPWLIFCIFALLVSVVLLNRATRRLYPSDRPLSQKELHARMTEQADGGRKASVVAKSATHPPDETKRLACGCAQESFST